MPTKFHIDGLSELKKALDELPKRVIRNHVYSGLRAGAMVIRDEARTLVPVRTGRLRRAIIVYRARDRSAGPTYNVGVSAGKKKDDPKGAWYGRFIELGTRRKAAKPFLRPAAESKAGAAAEAFRERASQRIEKDAAELAK